MQDPKAPSPSLLTWYGHGIWNSSRHLATTKRELQTWWPQHHWATESVLPSTFRISVVREKRNTLFVYTTLFCVFHYLLLKAFLTDSERTQVYFPVVHIVQWFLEIQWPAVPGPFTGHRKRSGLGPWCLRLKSHTASHWAQPGSQERVPTTPITGELLSLPWMEELTFWSSCQFHRHTPFLFPPFRKSITLFSVSWGFYK